MVSRRFLRIKALKSLYSNICSGEDGVISAQKKMLFSVNKSYELYHLMMELIVEVADYSSNKIDLAKKKQLATIEEINPNMKFVNNVVIAKIRDCESLNNFLSKNTLAWDRDNNLIGDLYTRLVNSQYYKEYMASEDNSFEADKKLVLDFYRNEIEDNDFLYSIVDDMSIYWIDEIEFITSKIINYLSKVRANNSIRIPELYQNDEDREFVKDLFGQSIIQYDEAFETISKYAKNWEADRVTVMDRLIITMAIVELEKFASIPTNVTFDEYIEISKHYSTRNSNIFINGILDKYVKENNIVK